MPFTSRQVYLKSTPVGMPTDDDFEIREETIADPADGEVVVRNAYMSVDPYMRGQMRMNWKPGMPLVGGAVGEVVASKHPDFPEGSHVNSNWGWREYFSSDGRGLAPVDPSLAPLSTYLGIMGMPGLTAWGGLLVTGEYKDGERVFVSAASGAVGSVVGQIAKIKGGLAIGSAGSDEKVAHLTSEFGFDHAFNYKMQGQM